MATQDSRPRTPPHTTPRQLAGVAVSPMQMSPAQLQARARGSQATANQLLKQALAQDDSSSRYTLLLQATAALKVADEAFAAAGEVQGQGQGQGAEGVGKTRRGIEQAMQVMLLLRCGNYNVLQYLSHAPLPTAPPSPPNSNWRRNERRRRSVTCTRRASASMQ